MVLDHWKGFLWGVVPVLVTAGIFYARKPEVSEENEFFSNQRWTMTQVVFCFVIVEVIELPLIPLLLNSKLSRVPYLGIWAVFHLYQLAGLVLFFRYVRQPLSAAGLSTQHAGSLALVGLKWVTGSLLIISLLFLLLPVEWLASAAKSYRKSGYDQLVNRGAWVEAAAMYFFQMLWLVIWRTLTEELQFRGLLYGALRKKFRPPSAIGLNAFCFMAVHGDVNPVTFSFGCLSAWMFERYHSLVPGLVVHGVWNLAVGLGGWYVGVMSFPPAVYLKSQALLAGLAFALTYGLARSKEWTKRG